MGKVESRECAKGEMNEEQNDRGSICVHRCSSHTRRYADSPFWGGLLLLRDRKDVRRALEDKILLKLERLNCRVIATFTELVSFSGFGI